MLCRDMGFELSGNVMATLKIGLGVALLVG